MKYVLFTMIALSSSNPKLIFDFNKATNVNNWEIVNDAVMGGKSSSTFKLSNEGYGIFEGTVSLENNGGFALVRYRFPEISTKEHTKVIIKLKGDGKTYQFRLKSNSDDKHSYVSKFSTSGDWQEVEISLNDLYPTFRGKRLNQPNFPNENLQEIAFLIGNKKNEDFKLQMDKIELK